MRLLARALTAAFALAVLLEGLEVRGGQGRLERSLLENDAVDEVLRSCRGEPPESEGMRSCRVSIGLRRRCRRTCATSPAPGWCTPGALR